MASDSGVKGSRPVLKKKTRLPKQAREALAQKPSRGRPPGPTGTAMSKEALRKNMSPREKRLQGKRGPEELERMRRRVEVLIGSNMTTMEVCIVMGLDLKELIDLFGDTVDTARVKMKAEANELMWDLARKGSSPMVRRVLDLTNVPQTREAFRGQSKPAEEKKKAEPKLGKKEQQALAAANPDTTSAMGALMAQRAARLKMN